MPQDVPGGRERGGGVQRAAATAPGPTLQGAEMEAALVEYDQFAVEDQGLVEVGRRRSDLWEGTGQVGSVPRLDRDVAGVGEDDRAEPVPLLFHDHFTREGTVRGQLSSGFGEHRRDRRGQDHPSHLRRPWRVCALGCTEPGGMSGTTMRIHGAGGLLFSSSQPSPRG